VPIPGSAGFIITDSGVRHRLPDGDYNSRADECAAAVAVLGKTNSGLTSLRDLDASGLAAGREALGDVLYRRSRHVLTENARVHAAVAALEGDDLETLGALLAACHASLRDDFESSCNEVDSLVEIASSCAGVLGSRMLGGGFGGCVLSLARAADAGEAAMQIGAQYAAIIGKKPWMHMVEPADPAQEVV
jgi:galactokinase